MIKILDDWFSVPDFELDKAETAEYKDYTFDGVTWPHIAITEDQESIDTVSVILGFEVESSFPAYYRYYKETDSQPMYVHSDVNEGEYTLLIFLNKVNNINGLAFWEHINGQNRAEKSNVSAYFADSNDASKWLGPSVVPAIFNRAVLFEAAEFHSRWPAKGWDIGKDTERLVKVLFLKKKCNCICHKDEDKGGWKSETCCPDCGPSLTSNVTD